MEELDEFFSMFEFVVLDDEVELVLEQPVITNGKVLKVFLLSF